MGLKEGFTFCGWDVLVDVLRKSHFFKGVITDQDTVVGLTFTTPDGQKIEVPKDSRVDLYIEPVEVGLP